MEYEFEGRTEKEAIDKAAAELGLEKDDFDVEILETQKTGLFKKGFVRIRVHTGNTFFSSGNTGDVDDDIGNRIVVPKRETVFGEPIPQNEFEQKMIDFTTGLIDRMGYPGKASVLFREKHKLGIKIDSSYSSILIGKKGKNLDALQLLLNVYADKLGRQEIRVILDTENYRIRREESLVRLAYNVAEKVRENRGSILLEPMNPFDRWLIHTTLNDIGDVETKSEGDGLYKQVMVYYKGFK
ncbi:MAG: protein jag [Treponema sp.]|jgi:spoIIIJ-associated protein|nr:protein jag [Treponema sp.]